MLRFVLRRLVFLIPVLLLISVLSFGLLVSMPGDPLDMLAFGNPGITKADINRLKQLYGVDEPFPVRYAKWMAQIAQGNFGYSRTYKISVVELVTPRIENTLILAGLSLLVSLVAAIPLGIYSAVHPYSVGDYVATTFAFFGYAVPAFWLGLMMIILFAVDLNWLPAGGLVSTDVQPGLMNQLSDRLIHLILPVFVLSLGSLAVWARYMRSSLLEVIHMEYIQTARAKGLRERAILYHHALRNALIPMVTLFANTFPILLGGSVIVETVFSYPGMGKLLYDSVLDNDFSVSMAILMFLAILVVLFNLLADVSYGILDPRVRYE
ncbi:MAG TPA: ABC transporter permease [Anaerolineae bacterium]|nr:ABC transporter permease [Anaerolineae bacterium]